MTKELKSDLEEAATNRQLVRVYREEIEGGWVDGYVVGLGPEFFALEIIGDDVSYNGFNCLRYADVTNCEVPAPNHDFVERALKLKGASGDSRYNTDLSSTALLVESAAARYPLITIHLEMEDPDICYIGAFVEIVDQDVVLRLLNSSAVWEDDPVQFELAHLTRVDFGGDYEEALWLVANNPA